MSVVHPAPKADMCFDGVTASAAEEAEKGAIDQLDSCLREDAMVEAEADSDTTFSPVSPVQKLFLMTTSSSRDHMVLPTDSIDVLACVLNQLCGANDNDAMASSCAENTSNQLTKFHALSKPSVPILEYATGLLRHSECSPECFVAALIYMDCLVRKYPARLAVNSFTVHRLLLSALVVAIKNHEDTFYSNHFYATIGGVDKREMNSLEIEFLFACDFNLFIARETYAEYFDQICTHSRLHASDGPCRMHSP